MKLNKSIEPELAGVSRLASIISIILFAYIISFLLKLESIGCECAKDSRRTYILIYCIYCVVNAIFIAVNPTSPYIASLMPITFGAGILFVIFTMQYVHRLKKEKCMCSEQLGRTVLYIVAAIDGAVFALFGLIILISALAWAIKS